jgi:hypothetical protein
VCCEEGDVFFDCQEECHKPSLCAAAECCVDVCLEPWDELVDAVVYLKFAS